MAWSRFRVMIPTWDRTLGTLVACLDATLRRVGGAPTYLLTDNEKTVTIEHVAGVAVRHPEMVAAGRHYGCKVETCVPYDPESKGGSESTVRVAKEWVGRSENLALGGPSGSGKSHFVEALAHAVIDAGMRVSWFSLESLTAIIGRAKVDASVTRVVARICRSELIVVDDIGMLPPARTRPRPSTGWSTPPTNGGRWR